MRTCTVCGKTKPDVSFPGRDRKRTQLSRWCRDCYTVKRAEWHRSHSHRAHKEEERANVDALQWAGLHCRHISEYVTRVAGRFERKTGLEAPPQLLAIRQIADQYAESLPIRPKGSRPGHIVCRNCGREFLPRGRGGTARAWCSAYCKDRFRQISEVFDTYEERLEKERVKQQSQLAKQDEQKSRSEAVVRARRERREPIIARASQAASLRRQGMPWKNIALLLDYSGPGHAFNDIKCALGIDPRTLRTSAGQGVDK